MVPDRRAPAGGCQKSRRLSGASCRLREARERQRATPPAPGQTFCIQTRPTPYSQQTHFSPPCSAQCQIHHVDGKVIVQVLATSCFRALNPSLPTESGDKAAWWVIFRARQCQEIVKLVKKLSAYMAPNTHSTSPPAQRHPVRVHKQALRPHATGERFRAAMRLRGHRACPRRPAIWWLVGGAEGGADGVAAGAVCDRIWRRAHA